MKKINKKKITIVISILILLIITSVFGRYIYNNLRDMYLVSQRFNFTSNLLDTNTSTYRYSNWSGIDTYEIPIELYSYENELSLFEYEGQGLTYTLTCKIDDESKATCHIDSETGEANSSGYIPNETNIKKTSIYIVPTAQLNVGDKIKITVEAQTLIPYKKNIAAEFYIEVSEQNISYTIEDKPNSIYAVLRILNAKSTQNKITLDFNPEDVMIDVSDDAYVKKLSSKSTTISGIQYVNSITFNMNPEEIREIKFYKKNISNDYTYPGGTNGGLIVNITEGK